MKLSKYFIALGLATAGMIQSVGAASGSDDPFRERLTAVFRTLVANASAGTLHEIEGMLMRDHSAAAAPAALGSIPVNTFNDFASSFLATIGSDVRGPAREAFNHMEDNVSQFISTNPEYRGEPINVTLKDQQLLLVLNAFSIWEIKGTNFELTPRYLTRIAQFICAIYGVSNPAQEEAIKGYLLKITDEKIRRRYSLNGSSEEFEDAVFFAKNGREVTGRNDAAIQKDQDKLFELFRRYLDKKYHPSPKSE